MRRIRWFLVLSALSVLVAGLAVAQPLDDEGLSPEDVKTGEVVIAMNTEYATFRVDGERWDDHEFLKNGRQLILHRVNREMEHEIRLDPLQEGLEGVTLNIRPSDWKLAKINRIERVWRVSHKVAFKKAAPKQKGATGGG